MATRPKPDPKRMKLEDVEAWLRSALPIATFAFVLTPLLGLLRTLFAELVRLRAQRASGRKQPPSERYAALHKQLSFAFSVPANDVCVAPTARTAATDGAASGESSAPEAAPSPVAPPSDDTSKKKTKRSKEKKERTRPGGRSPLTETCAHASTSSRRMHTT